MSEAATLPGGAGGPPLAGLTVVDLTRLLPGPLATQHLADLGAEVIKVEDPGAGDYARSLGPLAGESSLLFQVVNRNKNSRVLDLKSAAGREALLALAEGAEVLVEGFRPGVMARLGLDYATLARRNPRLVYCSITGYGQTGPLARRAGHDINYIGYAGVLDQIGVAGGPPVLPNFQIGDLLGGTLTALAGILAALLAARQTGQGRHVDVAMADGVLAHAIFPLVEVLEQGRAAPRGEGLLCGGVPCYGVYATADGRHLAVGALEEKFWQALCATLERPDLLPYHLATGEQGAYARQELAAVFARRSQAEWVALFEPVDCCVSPVLRLEESLAHPHFVARGMVAEVAGVPQYAPPFGLRGWSAAAARPAPGRGGGAS